MQLQGPIMPIQRSRLPIKARKITDEEREFSVFKYMRKERINARMVGIRAKKAREKAEEEAFTKK